MTPTYLCDLDAWHIYFSFFTSCILFDRMSLQKSFHLPLQHLHLVEVRSSGNLQQ